MKSNATEGTGSTPAAGVQPWAQGQLPGGVGCGGGTGKG